jgi:hypothetical protein
MVKSYILFFLANSYKLVHQGELLLLKTMDPEGLREKPLEKGLLSRSHNSKKQRCDLDALAGIRRSMPVAGLREVCLATNLKLLEDSGALAA